MNGTLKDSGRQIDTSSVPQTGDCARIRVAGDDLAKLAAIIAENRVRINKYWEELDRLNGLLASLGLPRPGVSPRDLPAANEPTAPRSADSPSIIARLE